MNIFIGGSLENIDNAKTKADAQVFVAALVREILGRGHRIYLGCMGGVDAEVARTAQEMLGDQVATRLTSYFLDVEPAHPAHDVPEILPSRIKDWGLAQDDLRAPEQIAQSDLAVIVAGTDGTHTAANWARIEGKPVLGIARFSGAGKQVYRIELGNFDRKYSHLLDGEEFEVALGSMFGDPESLARHVVEVAEKMLPTKVFPVMSFDKEYDELFDLWAKVCTANGYVCERTDRVASTRPITQRILQGIKRSPFVLADISKPSPNVYFEIGYARGHDREVIVTKRGGALEIPFDLKDVPVTPWESDNLAALEQPLDAMVKGVKARLRKRQRAEAGLLW